MNDSVEHSNMPAQALPLGQSPDENKNRTGIFAYLDYREYLAQWFRARKSLERGYSGAVFAKKAGLGSHTLLGMVIRGERNLSPSTIRGFVRAIGIKGKESLYFEKLVLFNQAKNSEDRAYYFDQLCAASGGSSSTSFITKIKNHSIALSHWYLVAVHQLVQLEDFKPDPVWMAQRLKNKITSKQAAQAWQILKDLEMVRAVTEGERTLYRTQDRPIDIDLGHIDFAINHFHKEFMERAIQSIEGESLSERKVSTLTFAVPEGDFAKIVEKVDEFRKSLSLEISQSSKPRNQVVTVIMQSMMLTATPKAAAGEQKK